MDWLTSVVNLNTIILGILFNKTSLESIFDNLALIALRACQTEIINSELQSFYIKCHSQDLNPGPSNSEESTLTSRLQNLVVVEFMCESKFFGVFLREREIFYTMWLISVEVVCMWMPWESACVCVRFLCYNQPGLIMTFTHIVWNSKIYLFTQLIIRYSGPSNNHHYFLGRTILCPNLTWSLNDHGLDKSGNIYNVGWFASYRCHVRLVRLKLNGW